MTRIVPSWLRGANSGLRLAVSGRGRVYSSSSSSSSSSEPTSASGNCDSGQKKTAAADAEAKLAELKESYLRSLADMENLRARTRREVEAASSFAIQKFCKDVIGVADVLELALGSVRGDPRTAALLEGKQTATSGEPDDAPNDAPLPEQVLALSKAELAHRLKDLSVGLSMTLAELVKVFSRHGLTAIDPIHQKFDPNYHLALYEIPSEEHEAGVVLAVQKKGYLLHHRVIRPAAVGVSRKP